jgi:hypothetical protein
MRFQSLVAAVVIALGAQGIATAQPKGAPSPTGTAPPAVAQPPLPAAPPAAALAAPKKVSFGPAGPGTGSVTVRGAGTPITFDGRPIGSTPLTISDIPRGDYIVEGTDADGKPVSRPVTIDEGAEAAVDLGAGMIAVSEPGAVVVDEGHPKLLRASKVVLGVSAAALLVGAVFGVLELKQHSDYESAPANQAILDSMARTGQRDAMIANASFVAFGATLIAAGALALPTYLHHGQPAEPTAQAFVSTGAHGAAMAGFAMRF